jgi:transcriptional regulator with XRE-family HTH domain
MRDNAESLQKAVASIRTSRKMKGYDITLEEIAKKAGISTDQLLAFLSGEGKIPKDFTINLLSSYNFTFITVQDIRYEDINIPEVKEDEIDD